MINWNEEYDVEERPNYRGRPFNKEKFCKKNKIGNGQYGPHIYENGNCVLCGKIDPQLKFKPFKENNK